MLRELWQRRTLNTLKQWRFVQRKVLGITSRAIQWTRYSEVYHVQHEEPHHEDACWNRMCSIIFILFTFIVSRKL